MLEFLIVNINNKPVKVALSDIFYITTSGEKPHVLNVITFQGLYKIHATLSSLESKLQNRFFRCHCKYFVNFKKIHGFNNSTNSVLFFGDQVGSIPYSRYKKKNY
ncbi:LytR/AlgR family response regulator transcription factor [Streptococcus phocae subsp. salmonis]